VTTVRFEVYEQGGDTWFRLVGRNREMLMYSGPQPDLPTCLERIGELKAATNKGAFFRTRRSRGGAYYFTIEVAEGILATGHLYRARRERDVKMTVVRERLAEAPVMMRESETGPEIVQTGHTDRIVIDPAAAHAFEANERRSPKPQVAG
jgi:hypothetical protein